MPQIEGCAEPPDVQSANLSSRPFAAQDRNTIARNGTPRPAVNQLAPNWDTLA